MTIPALLDEAQQLWRQSEFDDSFLVPREDKPDYVAAHIWLQPGGSYASTAPEGMLEFSLTVSPLLHGQGVGRACMKTVCEMADRHGVTLFLEVDPVGLMSTEDVVAWYQRSGFSTDDCDEDHFMIRMPGPSSDLKP